MRRCPSSHPEPTRRGWWPWVVGGLLAVGAGLLFTFPPAGSPFYPKCPFHFLTGWHCPGCGTLRGLHCLLHGRVLDALAFNPLMICLLPAVACTLAVRALLRNTDHPILRFRLPAGWIMLLAVVLTVYWVLRNVPAYPFTLLAPGGGL